MPQRVVVNAALAVGVHPDDRLILAGAPRLLGVGIGRGQDHVAGLHHRVLVQLVDRVDELGGKAVGDRVLDRGLLHGVDVLRPVEALGPPAAGDRLAELGPVRVREGARGEVEDDQPLALVLHGLQERRLVRVGPLRLGRSARACPCS